ncbi:MAG TPA: alcohol dehydrogenase catalytic domain-containing protein [Bacillota bacterium]|nr:alcohol dehydrogenase catalytic domain-containing protein [Bacillota bacterium]
MLAVRYYGIGQVKAEEIPRPVCGPGQALVRVACAGICGSDLHIFRKGMFVARVPETMGHEFSGVVEEVGAGVGELSPGDHVVGDPRVFCGRCRWCLRGDFNLCPGLGFIGEVSQGCFAEYLVMDAKKLLKVPPEIDLRRAALVEPLAVALHIAGRGRLSAGDHLGIAGAGPVGLLTLIVARSMGVEKVTVIDVAPARLELAARLGATVLAAFPEEPADRPDVLVEAAGLEETLAGAVRWLKPEGRLVMAGIYEDRVSLDPNDIVVKELELIGLSAYGTSDLVKAVQLIAGGLVDVAPLISRVLPLNEAARGFSLLTAAEKTECKILLAP